jgi:hypothetical protein
MKYNLSTLSSKIPKEKYDMQKLILKISQDNPKEVYKDFDFFVNLLDSKNNIMVWTGILVIGNLASVDNKGKIEKILPLLFKKLNTGKMITAGNTIKSLIKIASHKPDISDNIVDEILKVKGYKYDSEECSRILTGLIFSAIGNIWNIVSDNSKRKILDYAKTEIDNKRNATSKKVKLFLKRYGG